MGGGRATLFGPEGREFDARGSAFVVDPDCFKALAAAESVPPKSVRNPVVKLGRLRTGSATGTFARRG